MHIRLTDKLKAEIQDQAQKNARDLSQEVLVLLAEALHRRKFNTKDWI